MLSKIALIAIFAAIFCQLSQQKTTRSVKGKPDFSGCDDEYQCFGLPDKCLNKEEPDCQVLLKTQPLDNGVVEFNLIWERPSNSSDSWVAAALSEDQKMGDDSATVFMIYPNGTIDAEQGLTFVNGMDAGVAPEQVDGITVLAHKYVSGRLITKWNRNQKTTVRKLPFDMKAKKYYILLAYGPMQDGKIKHHTSAGMSAQAINLEDDLSPSSTPGKSSTPKPTGQPKTTPKSKGNASTITLSIFVTIFATILLILN